jgi:iron complex outermembrane receptor protein
MIRRRLCPAAVLPLSVLFLLILLSRPSAAAPATGSLAGKVTTVSGGPVPGAEVHLPDARRNAVTSADGTFRFEGLPPGDYLIEATEPRLGAAVQRVTVKAGGTAEVTLGLDLTVHREEIVVTASPDARSQGEVSVSTTVLDSRALQQQLAPTLGETLNQEPGISSTFFGPGASRPVIRGLGGDRIRILESGVGTGDASTTSPDHAVSVDPSSAERIEVVRGPATLLYGSSAIGGVVNLIDGRIPDSLPGQALTGTFDGRGASAADERGGDLTLNGGAGRMAWHLDALKRQTGDYRSGEGRVANSALDADGGGAGVSYVGQQGYLGVAYGRFDTLYGSPAEEDVKIDLHQRRYDLEGKLDLPLSLLRGVKVRFGKTDYEHTELEGGEVGTRFLNDSWEGRVEALQQPFGPFTGSFGVQTSRRDFSAIGEESFVPPTRTDSRALFTLQELNRGALRYQVGLRYEAQTVDATLPDLEPGGVRNRDLNGLSGSFGLIWLPGDTWSTSLSLSRSVKLPNAEELFANGPHVATDAFEIGDPTLSRETNLGAEASLRRRAGRVTGELNLFVNRFDGFIYEQLTGEEEDDLQVIRFVQRDADFRGAELTGIFDLYHGEPDHVDVELGADYVRAELRDTGEPLPRIPPVRYRLALHYRGERFQGKLEGQRVQTQDRVASFETSTPGYTLVNATLSYRLFATHGVYDLVLRGTNLTDQLARNHVSFLKDVAPLPGRDFSLALRYAF